MRSRLQHEALTMPIFCVAAFAAAAESASIFCGRGAMPAE
jgi:hypothetical protein